VKCRRNKGLRSGRQAAATRADSADASPRRT
jgi:hypothetical protein